MRVTKVMSAGAKYGHHLRSLSVGFSISITYSNSGSILPVVSWTIAAR